MRSGRRPVLTAARGIAALIVVLTAPLRAEDASPAARIDTSVVTVAVFDTGSPVLSVDAEGAPGGVFPELLERVLADLGHRARFVAVPTFSEAYARVRAGEIDLLPAVLRTDERERELSFTDEPCIVSWSQVFAAPGRQVDSLLELEGGRVAMIRDDANGLAFVRLMASFDVPFEPIIVADFTLAADAVLHGTADALVAFSSFAIDSGLTPTGIVFNPSAGHVATQRGRNGRLLEQIDARLRELKDDADSYYHDIIARLLEGDPRSEIPAWAILALAAVGIALVATLVAWIIARRRIAVVTQRLEQSQHRFRMLFDLTADSVLVYRVDDHVPGRFVEANDGACRRLGYDRLALLGIGPTDLLAPDDRERYAQLHKGLHSTGSTMARVRARDRDGDPVEWEVNLRRFASTGEDYVIASARDVGDRLETERRLRESLAAKETLLKEIHHRVKNNLQTISSLMSIRLMSTNDERLRQSLREMSDRVFAMGLLHRMLYQNDDLESIDVREYAQMLCRQVWSSFGEATSRVRLRVDAEHALVNLDTALPFGLVVNEAITNALKHAFPDGRCGTITVSVRVTDGRMELTVQDDGIGIPAEPALTGGMGTRMISMLAAQLDGHAEIVNGGGTSVVVSFPHAGKMVVT